MKNRVQNQKGQTLLELVIALGVIALVVTGLVVAATSALRFSQEGRLRSSGVRYAQEGLEKAREIRDTGTWDDFLTYAASSSKSWCLDSTGTWTESTGTCDPIAAGSLFTREITFTWADPIMTVESVVTWPIGSKQAQTSLKTYFTQWK